MSAPDYSLVHPLPGHKLCVDYDPSEDEKCPSCIGKLFPSLLREGDMESDGPAWYVGEHFLMFMQV
jgi:hypothetical protein